MVVKKKASAKKKTIGQKEPKVTAPKNEKESKKISLNHEFSFNLLTEHWLPVVTAEGERKLLSLNEFLKLAHELERFDFPLPGLETAVIRFLVAIVYIVGAPKNKKEWEEWYDAGIFSNSFIEELQSYKKKLDLFSTDEPFMQVVEVEEKTIKPVSKLIEMFPSGNNSTHFGILDLKKDFENEVIQISPGISIPILFYCYLSVLAGTDGDAGINGGATPYFLTLHSTNLFKTILWNTLDTQYIYNNLSFKGKCKEYEKGWNNSFTGDTNLSSIRIQDALLWKSRQIRLLPIKSEHSHCSVTGNVIHGVSIKQISYTKQRESIAKGQLWEDVFNSIVNDPTDKKKPIKKLKPFGDFPAWKDYPNLIIEAKGQDKEKSYAPPIILSRFLNYKSKESVSLSVMGVITSKAKVSRLIESKFPFKPSFIEDKDVAKKIKTLVQLTKKFESVIFMSLIVSLNLEKKLKSKQGKKVRESILSLFQSSYWYELGSAFEESLSKLSGDEDSNQVLQDWKKMLAAHVRDTFKRHTTKLISNPKNLKAYENGRKYLEIMIYKELLPKENK